MEIWKETDRAALELYPCPVRHGSNDVDTLRLARLAAFERVLFAFAKPGTVVITTPNRQYNVKWPGLPAGHFRHRDHRFEWTRAEFEDCGRARSPATMAIACALLPS